MASIFSVSPTIFYPLFSTPRLLRAPPLISPLVISTTLFLPCSSSTLVSFLFRLSIGSCLTFFIALTFLVALRFKGTFLGGEFIIPKNLFSGVRKNTPLWLLSGRIGFQKCTCFKQYRPTSWWEVFQIDSFTYHLRMSWWLTFRGDFWNGDCVVWIGRV